MARIPHLVHLFHTITRRVLVCLRAAAKRQQQQQQRQDTREGPTSVWLPAPVGCCAPRPTWSAPRNHIGLRCAKLDKLCSIRPDSGHSKQEMCTRLWRQWRLLLLLLLPLRRSDYITHHPSWPCVCACVRPASVLIANIIVSLCTYCGSCVSRHPLSF